MRIGISDFRKWGEEHFARLAAYGFSCYDFNMADTEKLPYTLGVGDFEAYIREQKRLADEAGIAIWQVHGPWRFPIRDGGEDDRAERLEKMTRSIRATALLGAKYWVVHPLMPCGLDDKKTGRAAETYAINRDFMARLLAVAEREGVTVCLENMPFVDFSLSTPTEIADFVREMAHPNFRMCLDTGHVNTCPDWGTPGDALRAHRDGIRVLHVHDNMGERDEHLVPTTGTIDWQDFSAALREVDFSGVLSLECGPRTEFPDEALDAMYRERIAVARMIGDGKGVTHETTDR